MGVGIWGESGRAVHELAELHVESHPLEFWGERGPVAVRGEGNQGSRRRSEEKKNEVVKSKIFGPDFRVGGAKRKLACATRWKASRPGKTGN